MKYLFMIPIAHADDADLDVFVNNVAEVIINPIITILVVVAILLFFTGALQFFVQKDQNSEGAQRGKRHMLWGIIGIFIMLSVWGIMGVITNSLGV